MKRGVERKRAGQGAAAGDVDAALAAGSEAAAAPGERGRADIAAAGRDRSGIGERTGDADAPGETAVVDQARTDAAGIGERSAAIDALAGFQGAVIDEADACGEIAAGTHQARAIDDRIALDLAARDHAARAVADGGAAGGGDDVAARVHVAHADDRTSAADVAGDAEDVAEIIDIARHVDRLRAEIGEHIECTIDLQRRIDRRRPLDARVAVGGNRSGGYRPAFEAHRIAERRQCQVGAARAVLQAQVGRNGDAEAGDGRRSLRGSQGNTVAVQVDELQNVAATDDNVSGPRGLQIGTREVVGRIGQGNTGLGRD